MPGDEIRGETGDEARDVNVGKNIRSRRSESGRQTVTIGSEWNEIPATLFDIRSELRYQSQQMGQLTHRMSGIETSFVQLRESFSLRLAEQNRDIESIRDNMRTLWLVGVGAIVIIVILGSIAFWNLDRRVEDVEQRQDTYQRFFGPTLPGVTP